MYIYYVHIMCMFTVYVLCICVYSGQVIHLHIIFSLNKIFFALYRYSPMHYLLFLQYSALKILFTGTKIIRKNIYFL